MLRKILAASIILASVSGLALADLGLALRCGFSGEVNNLDRIRDVVVTAGSKDYDGNLFNFGLDVFYEKNKAFGTGDKSWFGVKAGYTMYSKAELTINSTSPNTLDESLQSTAYAIPLTAYYKYAVDPKVKLWGGLGAAFLSNKWEFEDSISNIKDDETMTTVMPHIKVGVDLMFSKNLSFGIDLGYQFNGEMESDYAKELIGEKGKRDFSGVTGNVSVIVHLF